MNMYINTDVERKNAIYLVMKVINKGNYTEIIGTKEELRKLLRPTRTPLFSSTKLTKTTDVKPITWETGSLSFKPTTQGIQATQVTPQRRKKFSK